MKKSLERSKIFEMSFQTNPYYLWVSGLGLQTLPTLRQLESFQMILTGINKTSFSMMHTTMSRIIRICSNLEQITYKEGVLVKRRPEVYFGIITIPNMEDIIMGIGLLQRCYSLDCFGPSFSRIPMSTCFVVISVSGLGVFL